ncbi:hypothetical protein FHR56_003112 [Xanthomonas sacchari]|uniref:hypothetical protein n=1 Tax=unclassified Xanthomonas TaxID=2643310 RepID=UPI0017AEF4EC|nr:MULTISPECIES: hypothetical protein [unclassified Xanthomonas]MBB6367947.1 hypothetical protein [Xanthomonas sp. F10]
MTVPNGTNAQITEAATVSTGPSATTPVATATDRDAVGERAGAAAAASPPVSPTPPSMLKTLDAHLLARPEVAGLARDALDSKIARRVQRSNAETMAYAPTQVEVGSNMLIRQAPGLVAQSAAVYFDGVSKTALASQSVLLKNLAENRMEQAAEGALGVLATDMLVGAAAAVAAAAGALEAESATSPSTRSTSASPSRRT